MGSIKGEETKELSKHHGQMSNQTGLNPIILEIRRGCVQYDIKSRKMDWHFVISNAASVSGELFLTISNKLNCLKSSLFFLKYPSC